MSELYNLLKYDNSSEERIRDKVDKDNQWGCNFKGSSQCDDKFRK